MESEVFSSEEYDGTNSSHIRRYKIASELKKYSQGKTAAKCFRIPECQIQGQEQPSNIFESEDIQRVPESFVETAKQYQIVGYKYVKTTTQKKDKRKLYRKNTSSASSRHSKCSNSLPTLDRGVVSKQTLLERVKNVNNKQNNPSTLNTRLVQSKNRLDSFSKFWHQHILRGSRKLNRRPSDSLLCLSDVFRSKMEKLQQLRLNQIRNNPRPQHWEVTLCNGRSGPLQMSSSYAQLLGKQTECSRTMLRTLGNNKSEAPYITLVGRNKLKQEAEWLLKNPHRHFLPTKPL